MCLAKVTRRIDGPASNADLLPQFSTTPARAERERAVIVPQPRLKEPSPTAYEDSPGAV